MEFAAINRARAARWPAFLAWMDEGQGGIVERSPHGEAGVLVVDGVHVVAPLAPDHEAECLAQSVDPSHARLWCFGLGEGRVVSRFLARSSCRELQVVGLSRRAARAVFEQLDATWLDDPRVRLASPLEVPARVFVGSAGARVLSSAELRLAEPSALRDAILLELAAAHQARWLAGRRMVRTERVDANAARFPDDGDVGSLFDSRPGAHAVVCGGGPSLLAVLEHVARADALLVAVSTALAPLERRGIAPDVAVMVDAHPALIAHLRALQRPEVLARVPLVYAADVDAEVLAAWPGPRLAAHLALPGYDGARTRRAVLHCSGTVSHTAVDLAVRMGASTVRFAGLDFAYPNGATHAEGAAFAAQHKAGRVTVESVRGELVTTDVNLLGYLRDLERYIAAHPTIRFVNGSVGGARIAGTSHEPPPTHGAS